VLFAHESSCLRGYLQAESRTHLDGRSEPDHRSAWCGLEKFGADPTGQGEEYCRTLLLGQSRGSFPNFRILGSCA